MAFAPPGGDTIPPPVFPVILCGGSGERLWPMSRPWRPKPFLPLVGPLSGFQAAARRAAPLALGGELIVIGGEAHRDLIRSQLAAIGVKAQVLLEPVGRDTAPAIVAAAAWVAREHADGILVVLAADHHIPDDAAFQEAVRATLGSASEGAIVTLGVRPLAASVSYGYIRPAVGDGALRPIAGFEEKPDAERAVDLIASGALWNSGTFIASATTLQYEVRRLAPEVAQAIDGALEGCASADGEAVLGAAFAQAPKIAFDRAVMERTDRGAVLPVDFAWSDLGAWDAVLEASERDADGSSLGPGARAIGARDVLARTAAGVQVTVVGVSRVAVVVEPDAVLVCDLDASQDVRGAGATRLPRFHSLDDSRNWYATWLRTAALPIWATLGVDPRTGAFLDALTVYGERVNMLLRARVQARQAFVFATSAAIGLPGPWLETARTGLTFFQQRGRLAGGLFASSLEADGRHSDPTPRLYEQAFLLLAFAGLHRADRSDAIPLSEAHALHTGLQTFRHIAGGFREAGPEPFQANAQMHLFEAALAWAVLEPSGPWLALADEIAELAFSRFIDPTTGALSEFFDADWRSLNGEAGLIEPGHQFEWAWLLARWGRLRHDLRGMEAARRLFSVGRLAFNPNLGVVANALDDDLAVRDPGARLWPQTEHLKAALILGETDAALQAANGLAAYLDTPARGVWRERMTADGGFLEQPSPATSLYHLFLAVIELCSVER